MREQIIGELTISDPRRPKGVEIEATRWPQLLLDVEGCQGRKGST